MLKRHRFDVLTSAGGAFTDTGPLDFGFFYAWGFKRNAGENAFDTGANIDFISVATGITIAHETAAALAQDQFIKFPWKRAHTDTGATDTGPALFPLAGDQVRLSITSGGNAQRGTIFVWTTDEK